MFGPAVGADVTLERSDILNIVSVYLRGDAIDGVMFSWADVFTMVEYYIRQQPAGVLY